MARRADGRKRTLRKDRTGASPVLVGVLTLAVIGVLTWLGFAKDNPFHTPFRMEAVVPTATSIRAGSPVRIAGVNVGKVVASRNEPGTTVSVLTLELQEAGLPVRKDARIKIRPRIFLEGNFFVDLEPGSPSAPPIGDGDTLPVTQASAPVQFDEILTALQRDTRRDLQATLQGLGDTLMREPTAADDADADADARGEPAAQSLNDTFATASRSLRTTAVVSEAMLGTEPDEDLQGLIRGLSRTTEGLGRDEERLRRLVSGFNATMAATAQEATALRATIRELDPLLRTSDGTLDRLNAAFPPTRALARDLLPGVRETPATIAASFPFITQARRLVSRAELGGLARDLSPATRDLSRVIDASLRLFPQADLAAKCATRTVLPTGDVKIQNGNQSLGVENYKGFWYTLVGLAGESQNFDGNGLYVRFQPGGGTQTVSVGPLSTSGDTLFGNAVARPLGTRPAYPGKRPPYRPDVPCFTQGVPDLNGAATGPPDGMRTTGAGR
jgi:phospholipid/cholesterol/gamma-HCH transport system substrate-binding protein